jgi:Undecaprenyl-phosphate glucose phosphotransferase
MSINLSVSGLGYRTSGGTKSTADDTSPVLIGRLERFLTKLVVLEFLLVSEACYFAGVIYNQVFLSHSQPGQYLVGSVPIAFLVLIASLGFKRHVGVQTRSRDRFLWSGLGAIVLAFSLFLWLLFVFKMTDWYSRETFFFQFFGAVAAMLIVRGVSHGYIRHAVRTGMLEARRAVLIGDCGSNVGLLKNLRHSGVRSVGTLQFPCIHGNTAPGVGAFSQNIRRFVERCRSFKPDDVFVLVTPGDLPKILCVVDALSELPVAVHIVPIGASDFLTSAKVTNFGETVTIQVLHPPLSALELFAKRVFDICFAGLGLLALSSFLFVISLAIKLDSRGPTFFRQTRHGYNNEVIRVFKFRTMTTTEDGHQQFKQAVKNDPRVTRIGRILRRTSMDEFPQLVNVLLGEMSIVGPRPHPVALNDAFAERISPFSRRHTVKPGITGWAQVNGLRGETDTLEKMQQRVVHDLYYIDNWSFLFDIKIILLTIFSKRAHANAF